jgi:hypothetical protein
VYRHFKDLDEDLPSQSRLALRNSLLVQAKESRTSAMFKIQYFRDFVQKVYLKPTIIGVEKEELDMQLSVDYKPHVILHFRQDLAAVPDGFTPLRVRISFRLVNESATALTRSNLNALAMQIKNELALNGGYSFNKGKVCCNYIDKENGYSLQIYALSEAEGEQVVKKILSLRNHAFDSDKFRVNTPSKNSLNNPGSILILGETAKKARWRPTGRVRFQYADLMIRNKMEPICLVDRSWARSKTIERVA